MKHHQKEITSNSMFTSPIFLFNSMQNDEQLPQEQKLKIGITKPTGRKSQSIPLPSTHVHRTQSEVQLSEDMETAERRDLNMFYRLVNGIRERQMNLVHEHHDESSSGYSPPPPQHHQHQQHYPQQQHPHLAIKEAESCVAHIIHTRNTPLDRNTYLNATSDHNSTSLPSNSERGHQQAAATEALHNILTNHQGAYSDPTWNEEEQPGDWSLSGFDELDENRQAAGGGTDSSSANIINDHHTSLSTSPIPTTSTTQHQVHVPPSGDDDEGIFDLDL